MQITLNQDEIEQSVRNHVLSQLAIREDQEISIDLRAGRGENGFTATLDVRPRKAERDGPKPAFTKIDEARQSPRLVGAESRKEDKPGSLPREAEEPQKSAAPPAPKKGIFAAAAKAAPEPTKETDTAAEEAKPGTPDQEMPAEEEAREDAQHGNEAHIEQSTDRLGARKSIFTFAPKKSAG